MRSALKAARYLVSDDTEFWAVGEVCVRLGVSRMTLWRLLRQQNFPQPIRYGGPNSPRHFRRSEVEAWLAGRAKTQGGGQ
jgi:excisionase family DNA binding protein